jgi:hypothetical protein
VRVRFLRIFEKFVKGEKCRSLNAGGRKVLEQQVDEILNGERCNSFFLTAGVEKFLNSRVEAILTG